MSNVLDALRKRAAERPRVTLAVAGGLACVVLLVVMLTSGGSDVAAVVTPSAPPPATATPAANGAATPSGTTVAGTTVAAAPAPANGSPTAAPVGSGTSGSADASPAGGEVASPQAISSAQRVEQQMNAGLPAGQRTPSLGTPVATSTPIAAAGKRLEKIASDYAACLPSAKDHYDCLAKIPAGVKTERIYDTAPYGVLIALKADDGTTVRLSIRGADLCRMLAVKSSCDAWSSAG